MNHDDTQRERWLAYLLGETKPEDAARIEAEMAEAPEEARALKKGLAAARGWASEPAEHSPVVMETLLAAEPASVAQSRWARRWPWAVAAGLLLIALTQLSFTVSVGDTSLAWGTNAEDSEREALTEQVADLQIRYSALADAANESADFLGVAAYRINTLEQDLSHATTELARNQRAETRARYMDVQRILELTGHRDVEVAAWMNPNSQ